MADHDHSFPKSDHFTAFASAAEEGTISRGSGVQLGVIPRYLVRFCNETPDSTGHEHHVCQREVEVTTWFGQEQAVVQAIALFEVREDIASWKMHAGTIECALMAPDN